MPEKLAFKKEACFFCYKKRMIFFLPLSTENDQHKNMEKLLSLTESSQPEPTMEKEKLRYVISKISIWDYFNISKSIYKALCVNEKSRLLNKYYSELYEKYYG